MKHLTKASFISPCLQFQEGTGRRDHPGEDRNWVGGKWYGCWVRKSDGPCLTGDGGGGSERQVNRLPAGVAEPLR